MHAANRNGTKRCQWPRDDTSVALVLTLVYVWTNVVTTYIINAIMKETKKARGTPEEAAFLDLLRTCDLLSRGLAQFLKSEDLSPTQYNVLRILRGAPPAGLPCGEIADRMITRDPDITRLLDRLEKRELISRCRETKDRRMVVARITPQGLKLLARLDEPVQEMHSKQLGHLGGAKLKELQDLLAAARAKVA
jgi:DNA-binding MarR family transcriptional regulator